ncbi:hypothetical protein [Streptomyces sp. NPDC002463]|uniref:hypothetical protein n=1 Tax=Streptomyces sp. NPDC002463 TaxID=3364645 RepID=UPI00368CCAF2
MTTPDGETDAGSGVIEDQEQAPATRGASTEYGSSDRSARPRSKRVVQPVCAIPGVEVLRAVAEAPEWTITHADSLRDQGMVVTGMLESGFTAQEIRHVLLSKPLPQPVRTTAGAIVARRLRDLIAVGPSAGVRQIPAQQTNDHA